MAIVPVYRLKAEHSGERSATERRYRFSREPTPDPNPHPGERNEDPDTRWVVEGVAFYAWSDRLIDGAPSPDLRPVYEFHRCSGERHQYYYSLEPEAPRRWERRPYVAFWAHAEDVEQGAPPVFRFRQADVKRENYVLTTDREVDGWIREDPPAFYASERVPVRVSVRRDEEGRGRFDWTFDPSTVNLAYGSILEFLPAPHSDFSFADLEVVNGHGDFEPPEISPERVRVRALCSTRGRDYKYNLRVHYGPDGEVLYGDPEIVNQTPLKP